MTLVNRWYSMVADELHTPWKKETVQETKYDQEAEAQIVNRKGMGKYWPILTAGAGLFSDGYVNNVSWCVLL